MDLHTASPAEIDGKLFPILGRLDAAQRKVAHHRERVERVEAEIVRKKAAGRHVMSFDEEILTDAQNTIRHTEETITAINAEADPFEAEFARRGGWTRYLVVQGGHLHYSHCHTLTPGRTLVGGVAEASGLDQAEVVGKFGEHACTHCFPDAPVAPKKTPAEEGFCEHSGEHLTADKLERIGFYRRRSVSTRCACGKSVAVTPRGVLRKHKTPKGND